MKSLQLGLVAISLGVLGMTACGGATGDGDTGDGDGDTTTGDGDGDIVGDGDGDIVGDGDGDIVGDGDGDIVGDGDGDSVTCTDLYAYGLNVVLVGGAFPPPPEQSGDPVEPEGAAPPVGIVPPDDQIPVPVQPCEATVVAVDGDYSEVLSCSTGYPNPDDCSCSGAGERAGTYTVTATWGHLTETQDVIVTADECHVQAQSLTFFGM